MTVLYLCRYRHFTESKRDTRMSVFCEGCKQDIDKSDMVKFQVISGKTYLAQQSKPWARERLQKYHVEYQRRYRARKRLGIANARVAANAMARVPVIALDRDMHTDPITVPVVL